MGSSIRLLAMIVCCRIMVIAAVTDPSDLGVLTAIRSSWQNLPPNWRGSDPCGSNWEGINCTNSRVTTLSLAGTGVRTNEIGDIPSLTMLQYLDLSNNRGIKANLPQSIQQLQNLTTLILVGCSFHGQIPDSIGSLKKLGFLGLNNNSFTGPIPPTIGNLTNLTWLDLSDNQLSGLIPITINATTLGLDRLVNARHFHLANNKLSGPISSLLFNLDMRLIHVILNNNQLNGTIPASIGTVGTLEVIRLDSNSLRGRVPQNITNAKNVNELYLSNNNLNGSVPNLVGMDSLFYVDMSNNSFDMSDIPSWFKLESLTTLLMDKTQLQGEIPSDMFHPQLERLVLSNNDLNGTLDIGNRYSSDLIVDLSNNSIANFTQESGYNMSLNLVNNPVCEGTGAPGRYCAAGNPNIPNSLPEISCTPVRCSSNTVLSPNCKCANPYTGTIFFFSYSFSNLDNITYYTILHDALMSAFQSNQLPVDSISITNATIDEFSYLQYRLNIFPSGQDYFTRSAVSSIGTVINRQQFTLPRFGPLFFLDESYCCFPGNKSSNRGIVIGAVVGSFVLLLLIAAAITYAIFQKRKAKRAKESSNPFASWELDNGSDVGGVPQLKGARACSFEELKRCSNNFSEENIIGSGGYGQVYKGTLNTGQVVAIKRAQQGSLQGSFEFKTEIELLSRIHHKNVVALVGFCYEQGEQMLVYEYISNGTLKDNLTGKSGMRLDWMKRLKVALDSANGLTYLHELANPPIIHRDVKSNNILLDNHLNAKVADFGLSKLLGDESKGYVSTQVKGTLGYMDPEYYMTQQLTEKSDVYSFGIVLLEMLTSRSPIHKGKFIVREVKEAIDKSGDPNGLYNILDPSLGSPKTLGGLTKFVNLAMRCVQDSGADRPKMGEVVREIESIIDLAVVSLDVESASTFSSQNTGNIGDLYYPYGDSVSDLVLICGFCLDLGFGHQCEHDESSVVHEVSHQHHHGCDHDHEHHGHEHVEYGLGVKKLPEELAEEEDLKMEFMSHHDHDHHHGYGHDGHDHGSDLSGVGLWIHAMGCSLLVSLASLICLILLPLIFFQGKPSKAFVDALAVFGAGAMLGDAFLHQLPHAFGGGHSHEHSASGHDHSHDPGHDHSPSHSHSIEDLSVGLSILFGIVVFLFVEKVVRYVEARPGDNSWGHGHHHHHHKKSEPVQDVNSDDENSEKMTPDGEKSSEPSGESLKTEKISESSILHKRNTVTNGVEDKTDSTAENGPKSNTKSMVEKEPVQSSSLVLGYLNLFSDGVHNFTDGMALGSAFLLYGSVGGWSRTLFLLAHELPQEIGDFGILVRSGFSVSKALFFNFLSALVALAGTALALSLGQDPGQSSLIEGFTAGGFIYIAVGVMAEMNNGSSSLKNSAIQLTSLVMGMSVALFISLIE